MIYHFPDLDTLRLALTSGALPADIALTPVRAQVDGASIRVEPAKAISKKADGELRRLGVKAEKSADSLDIEAGHWLQLLPLTPDPLSANLTAQTPVLFDLADAGQLPTLVGEMLRLGNDRQAFRVLTNGKSERVLLRVIGPPYYSLLRALDRDGSTTAPIAYVERRPRVWVRLGWSHPLLETITPAAGQLLFLAPPRQWDCLDEGPFQDIYEILEFALPAVPTALKSGELGRKLAVPLRLGPSGGSEAAEMWVLTRRAVEQVDNLVRELDDAVVGRLLFAVGQGEDGEPNVVLRSRPGKLAPPVLVLDAVGYRHYLKLANLFLPVGRRLQPPLRRDAVRKLLASSEEHVIWLAPEADGGFRPCQLPDAAFQPLGHWVDYILDRDHQALEAWMQSARFDFEPFICKEEQPPPPKAKPITGKRRIKAARDEGPLPIAELPEASVPAAPPPPRPHRQTPPSELQKELAGLEQKFVALEGSLDTPERQALWPRLAELNAGLGRSSDAAICWLHAMWEAERLPPRLIENWLDQESARPLDLEQALAKAEPSPDHLRAVAASLIHQSQNGSALSPSLLSRARQYLEQHESRLGVRPLWLAWLALAKQAVGDVLGLARARDRILDRLLASGLSSEHDLPSFLRFERGGDRYWSIRSRLMNLRELARHWIEAQPEMKAEKVGTLAYAELTFAFGLARLGEAEEARRLKHEAGESLRHRGDVHSCLLAAYDYRIDQAIDGKTHGGSLPSDQLEFIEHLSNHDRYKVYRLQQHSFVLEPQERFNPYRRHGIEYSDALSKRLVPLYDVHDRERLAKAVQGLSALEKSLPVSTETSFRIVSTVLGVAHRLGDANTLPWLQKAQELLLQVGENPDPNFVENQLMPILERGLLVAGHYDQKSIAEGFLHTLRAFCEKHEEFWRVKTLNHVLVACLRSLRKFGMREGLRELVASMCDTILKGKELLPARERLKTRWAEVLSTLAHLAAGWFGLGRNEDAWPLLDEARNVLLTQPELIYRDRTPLACNYAAALGQGPLDVALDRIEELFNELGRLVDPFETNTHYSLSQMDVVEAVVLAIVSDDFARGQTARRWLDDDEYMVRRRIHRDVRLLLNPGEAS